MSGALYGALLQMLIMNPWCQGGPHVLRHLVGSWMCQAMEVD
jgi:hypothetical protein